MAPDQADQSATTQDEGAAGHFGLLACPAPLPVTRIKVRQPSKAADFTLAAES